MNQLENFRLATKLLSVRIAAFFATLPALWLALTPADKAYVAQTFFGTDAMPMITLIGVVFYVWGRMAAQPALGANTASTLWEALTRRSVRVTVILGSVTAAVQSLPKEELDGLLAYLGVSSPSMTSALFMMITLLRTWDVVKGGQAAVSASSPEVPAPQPVQEASDG